MVPSPPPVLYKLTPSGPLPRIDTVKSVKHVVFSPPLLLKFNRFLRTQRVKLTLGYWLGVALGTCVLFSPPTCGIPLAIVSMPLQLVPSLASVMVMRFDMARLVTEGYEFWFMTLSNLAVCALIWFSFNDMRGLVMVGASTAFQTALLLDANHRASRLVSVATVLGALTNIVYVACATFGVIEYGRDLELLRYKSRVLYADDVTANLIATLVFLLVRNGVRKFREPAAHRVVSCITYRCRVVLVPTTPSAQAAANPPESSATSQDKAAPALTVCTHLTQMQFIDDGSVFSSDDTLFPGRQQSGPLVGLLTGIDPTTSLCLRASQRSLLSLASYVSLTGWVVAAVATNASLVRVASTLAVCGAGVVFAVYVAFSQRQLLMRLVTSFDAVFLSAQLTVAHACLADIVGWTQPRALAVLVSWLWMHWVLLLDAVLPIHKSTRLGFRRPIAVAVLVLFVAEQLLVAFALVLLDNSAESHAADLRLDLRDHEVFALAFHRRLKQLRVVPLLFGRLVSTISWSLRLLWRLWKSAQHGDSEGIEMIMLQGRVQYEALNTTGSVESLAWLAAPRVVPKPPTMPC